MLMRPILEVLSEASATVPKKELIEKVALKLKVPKDALLKMVPSNQQPIFENRISWATSSLNIAGLIEVPTRGNYLISQEGLEVLKSNVTINRNFLNMLKEKKEKSVIKTDKIIEDENLTPDEEIDDAYLKIKEKTSLELLENILQKNPIFFEKLVLKLMKALGYGDKVAGSIEHTGQTNDYGIDGIITQDTLGFDKIYIQAKRYRDTKISRSDIQKFVGALEGKKATKGLFITTSSFTNRTIDFACDDVFAKSIILIDGRKLTDLMYDYNVGVTIFYKYKIKRVNQDFFDE